MINNNYAPINRKQKKRGKKKEKETQHNAEKEKKPNTRK